MRRIPDDLRAAWQSLADVEDGLPGHDYDRGYLTGWYYARRHITRREPDGGFRDPERIREFRLGYVQGRESGNEASVDWWPDVALGSGQPGSGEPTRLRLAEARDARLAGFA